LLPSVLVPFISGSLVSISGSISIRFMSSRIFSLTEGGRTVVSMIDLVAQVKIHRLKPVLLDGVCTIYGRAYACL
jgi:hypothetical protein